MCYQMVSFVLGFCYKDYFYILNGIFKYQDCSSNLKPSHNKDFGSRSPAKIQRDKKAEPNFNPPRLLTGSSTRILKYVEDLKRDSNA